ncbi:unnamed protein product [Paramecium primaurelia]|uniref:Uncharacterized protein n=1 Tax=Paramecium primaurelia TaxID=5886 RepID=A0A8S1KXA1_PARPR|nr:unnamed protein product [Paramecium primaurelia]
MFCTSHPRSPISLVCVAEHKCQCQRKMCVECLYEHGTEIKQAVPINKFHEMLLKKLSENQLEDTSELIKQKISFKQLLSETEAIMKKLWEDLVTSIKLIYEMIEQENNSYINLIRKNENLAESSYNDLEKLVQIQNGRILDDWNYKKISYVSKLDKAKQWLEKEVKTFNEKFKQEMNEILQMFRIEKKEQLIWKEGTQQLRGIYWNYNYIPPVQQTIPLQITYTLDKEIEYFRDGSRLRIDKNIDITKNPEILTYLEQIQNLKWFGQYGDNNKQIGKWIIIWSGEKIQDVGGEYSNNGEKQGYWIELAKNYQKQAQVLEKGEYVSGQRNGVWKFLFQYNEIGGGVYKNGIKNGEWQELSDSFNKYNQVTYKGQYKNGKKVGRWDIQYRPDVDKPFITIGGGQYDEAGDGLKLGNWVEISDNFWNSSQVTYKGQYKNGKKVGRWDIQYRPDVDKPFITIGGGQYDEAGDGLKLGNWVEISDNFWNSSQVTYKGQYKNGKKVGRWDIQYRPDVDKPFITIGGGQYDEAGDGLKLGNWVEISDNFWNSSQVTYKGQYKNGKKVGRWDIQYRPDVDKPFITIGGGQYDEAGDGLKLGNWVEISDNFWNSSQVTYKGQYKNGKKVGRWDIQYRPDCVSVVVVNMMKQVMDLSQVIGWKYQIIFGTHPKQLTKVNIKMVRKLVDGIFNIGLMQINHLLQLCFSGGGQYDEAGDGLKLGNWVEISDNFWNSSQVTYKGQYKNGKKVGRWDIQYRPDCVSVVVVNMMKQVMDLSQVIGWKYQIIFGTHPKQLTKVNIKMVRKLVDGIFNIGLMQINHLLQLCFSGGGQYDEAGDGLKLGNWVEISDNFWNSSQVTYKGQYKNGKKVGRWDIQYRPDCVSVVVVNMMKQVMDLSQVIGWKYQIIFGTHPKQLTKVNIKMVRKLVDGIFNIGLMQINHLLQLCFSGGGQYDEAGDGLKLGNWVEISDNFDQYSQVTYKGQYKNGKKVGRWVEITETSFPKQITQIEIHYDY